MWPSTTPQGEALYRRRKAIVEPVFGQIKGRGFGRLSLRGLAQAQGEWTLIALTHNLLKLHKAQRPGRTTPGGGAGRYQARQPLRSSGRHRYGWGRPPLSDSSR